MKFEQAVPSCHTEVAMLELTMPPKQFSSDELCPKIRHVEGSQ